MWAIPTYIVELIALDGSGEKIDLGDADVQWEISAPLHVGSSCNHMLGTCLSARSAKLIADAPGTAEVRASFSGMGASARIVVE